MVNCNHPMNNQFINVLKILRLQACVIVTTNISKFSKWSCVLNCCSEFPGVFVTNSEINGDGYLDLPFIHFHHFENVRSCCLKNIFYLRIVKHVLYDKSVFKDNKSLKTKKHFTEIMPNSVFSFRLLQISNFEMCTILAKSL